MQQYSFLCLFDKIFTKLYFYFFCEIVSSLYQEGNSIIRQDLNEQIESLHVAPALLYHLPGFYLKTGFLNHYPLSLTNSAFRKCSSGLNFLIMNDGKFSTIIMQTFPNSNEKEYFLHHRIKFVQIRCQKGTSI